MQYILDHRPVANLDCWIEFELDGQRLVRRLVITAHKPDEISPASPVGNRLANARPGDQFTIPQPEPEPYLVVKVLGIAPEAALPAARHASASNVAQVVAV